MKNLIKILFLFFIQTQLYGQFIQNQIDKQECLPRVNSNLAIEDIERELNFVYGVLENFEETDLANKVKEGIEYWRSDLFECSISSFENFLYSHKGNKTDYFSNKNNSIYFNLFGERAWRNFDKINVLAYKVCVLIIKYCKSQNLSLIHI